MPETADVASLRAASGGSSRSMVVHAQDNAAYSVDENRNGHKEVFGTLQARRESGGFQGAVAFSSKDYGADAALEVSPTLRAGGHDASHANGGVPPAVAKVKNGSHWDDPRNAHPTLNQSHNTGGIGSSNQEVFSQRGSGIVSTPTVRRLTPRECERLQGFPDDFTAITYRNKPAADGPRYKALGNSMAVPVIGWILGRIYQLPTGAQS